MITSCFVICGCGDKTLKNGTYNEAGVIYEIVNNSAIVVGATEDATEITIPVQYKGAKIKGVGNNAFENSQITKVTFEENDFAEFFSIGSNAFRGSQIVSINNLPADATLSEDSLAGLEKLESITTFGNGELSVVNNALIQTIDENTKYLRLLPASAEPQDNFVNGTYTVTGYSYIYDYAVQNNKYISNLIICSDIDRIESYAFDKINLQSITFMDEQGKEVFIDATAFIAHKDLLIFVPATDTFELSSWMSYSKNYLWRKNWLIHPTDCNNTNQHCHGGNLNQTVTKSYEGWTYSINDNMASIKTNNITFNCEMPDYMLKTYEEIVNL